MKLTLNSQDKDKHGGPLSVVDCHTAVGDVKVNVDNVPDHKTSPDDVLKKKKAGCVKLLAATIVAVVIVVVAIAGLLHHQYSADRVHESDGYHAKPRVEVHKIHAHQNHLDHDKASGHVPHSRDHLTDHVPHPIGLAPGGRNRMHHDAGAHPHFGGGAHPHFGGRAHPHGGEFIDRPRFQGAGHGHQGHGHQGHGHPHQPFGDPRIPSEHPIHLAPPRPRTTHLQVSCSSNNYQPARCHVNGPILELTLIRQDSRSECKAGHSFKVEGNNILVTDGCRALFGVRLG